MTEPDAPPQGRRWVGPVVFLLVVVIVVLAGMLATSIMERRWEAQRPAMVLTPIADWQPDNAKWGENYPLEHESYALTAIDTTKTKFGGAFPRDYLEENPDIVTLFAGYGFSKDYLQARGHYHAVTDVTKTQRIKKPVMAATCWTCKSTDVPRVMAEIGIAKFYASNFHDLKSEITHPIGCQDCHDPKTMNLRITRPALREGFAAMGRDIDKATHQEMRSLVCAQCHVEYYFKNDKAAGKKNYLTFPWDKGTSIEAMLEYYEAIDFADWTHPVSKTRMIKAQHPDWELFRTGIHAYRGVSCADCHMPYRTSGGVKFTDHHVQSPLLNIAGSCAVCHRWGEQEIRQRVETIQTKVFAARRQAEAAVVKAHYDVAAGMQARCTEADLAGARRLLRRAQFRWDYIAASNGMGFHSPQESMRLLGEATNEAQQARLIVARLLAAKGISAEPKYPDMSDRKKAWDAATSFADETPPKLVP
jgi:nitrite reductase (cytochrome c-552)